MKQCYNCRKSPRLLIWCMWNTRTAKGLIAESNKELLCEKCAKALGAWQTTKQDVVDAIYAPPTNTELLTEKEVNQMFDEINSIIEHRQS